MMAQVIPCACAVTIKLEESLKFSIGNHAATKEVSPGSESILAMHPVAQRQAKAHGEIQWGAESFGSALRHSSAAAFILVAVSGCPAARFVASFGSAGRS